MIPRTLAALGTFAALLSPLNAKQALTLGEAVEIALQSNPSIEAAQAGLSQAGEGIRIAGAGRLPRISYTESYSRSNNPVFAFGSLLNQRQFGPSNFEIDRLNNPDALHNFQSLLQIEQTVFDFHRTKHALEQARLRSDLSAEQQASLRSEVILNVVRSYFGAILAQEKLKVADESVRTAESDLRRTQTMLEAGMATPADALSAQVYLATVQEERIRAAHTVRLSQAALNEVMGLDQSQEHRLLTALTAPGASPGDLEHYLRLAADGQPELRMAQLQAEIAQAQVKRSQSDLWPRIFLHGALEADRGTFASRAGGNWLAGVTLNWEIWKGSAKRAQIAADRHAQAQAEALERKAAAGVALRVRQAFFDLSSATERVGVANRAVEQAQESHRIIQNRYEAGLENVTELIRSQEAQLAAQYRHLAALYEQRVAHAALEHASGGLTLSSEALK